MRIVRREVLAFASDVIPRLTTIAERLAPSSTAVSLSTGMEFKPVDHFGECRAVNVVSVAGNVRFPPDAQ